MSEGTVCNRDEYHFCGDEQEALTEITAEGGVTQDIDTDFTVTLGDYSTSVQKRKRTLRLTMTSIEKYPAGIFLHWDGAGEYVPCGSMGRTIGGAVSENYEYTSTIFYFLDTRYNNALCKETVEHVTFSGNAAEMRYIGAWGVEYTYKKYKITNHTRSVKESWYIVLNGVRTDLKVSESESVINGPDNPLILVWPAPPSTGYFEDDDITTFGFYDYRDSGRIERDGGDDFYFTDWMRGVGTDYREPDQNVADNRYLSFYLDDGVHSRTYPVGKPEIATSTEPICSIAVDRTGNIFWACKVGDEFKSGLVSEVSGDIPLLFPDMTIFYPVAVL